ncbi:MAG TPA: hypothetical protein VF982_04515 [Anaerolineales bacterium]
MVTCPRCCGELHTCIERRAQSVWRIDSNGTVTAYRRLVTVTTYACCRGDPSRPACGFREVVDFRRHDAPVLLFTAVCIN